MVIGCARVSTDDQTNAAQLAELKRAGCKRIYEEKVSGRNVDRPELTRCLDRLDEGDTLVVWRLDRLGRSLTDLLEIVNTLQRHKVAFVSLKEKFDTSHAAGRLIFHVFASLAEFERELIRERTMAGLAAGIASGRLGGRKPKLAKDQMDKICSLWDGNQYSKQELGTMFSVSKSTIDRIVRPGPVKLKVATKARNPKRTTIRPRGGK
ncbi:recombinase family protein [Edaphobacter modestus]|uniref:DNA invertase Pin-like site-specific DNA recombinase n=1 Tax=Edaphobacter modestus TaxID=388466 RepID=A0A4Q7YSG7_9BACT|nr:recombinase family protein [Edaphobacter modestus]RZU40164.1 DNA invertase Pin-like site-specific DNA recombinase [Edaphobacter modestus]